MILALFACLDGLYYLRPIFINCLFFLTVVSLAQIAELNKTIRELKSILYGNSESEPVSEACVQLTQEFFRENTLRLLIVCLPKLNLEVNTSSMFLFHGTIVDGSLYI